MKYKVNNEEIELLTEWSTNVDKNGKDISIGAKLNELIKALATQVEEQPEPKKEYKRWRAEEGKNYWYIDSSNIITCIYDRENNHYTDNYRYKSGNYYETRDLSQKALVKYIALTELNDIIMEKNEGWVADWVSVNEKVAINYDHLSGGFIVQAYACVRVNPFILEIKSEEIAEYIIKNHKDLLDTIWGVESK